MNHICNEVSSSLACVLHEAQRQRQQQLKYNEFSNQYVIASTKAMEMENKSKFNIILKHIYTVINECSNSISISCSSGSSLEVALLDSRIRDKLNSIGVQLRIIKNDGNLDKSARSSGGSGLILSDDDDSGSGGSGGAGRDFDPDGLSDDDDDNNDNIITDSRGVSFHYDHPNHHHTTTTTTSSRNNTRGSSSGNTNTNTNSKSNDYSDKILICPLIAFPHHSTEIKLISGLGLYGKLETIPLPPPLPPIVEHDIPPPPPLPPSLYKIAGKCYYY